MEVLAQVQSLVTQHAFTVGVGFFVVLLIVALAWFWMSRGSKSMVLENQARVNEATTGREMSEQDAAEAQAPLQEQEQEQEHAPANE